MKIKTMGIILSVFLAFAVTVTFFASRVKEKKVVLPEVATPEEVAMKKAVSAFSKEGLVYVVFRTPSGINSTADNNADMVTYIREGTALDSHIVIVYRVHLPMAREIFVIPAGSKHRYGARVTWEDVTTGLAELTIIGEERLSSWAVLNQEPFYGDEMVAASLGLGEDGILPGKVSGVTNSLGIMDIKFTNKARFPGSNRSPVFSKEGEVVAFLTDSTHKCVEAGDANGTIKLEGRCAGAITARHFCQKYLRCGKFKAPPKRVYYANHD